MVPNCSLGDQRPRPVRALACGMVDALAAPPDGTWVALEPRGAEAHVAPDPLSGLLRESAYRRYTDNEYEDRRDPVEEGARF